MCLWKDVDDYRPKRCRFRCVYPPAAVVWEKLMWEIRPRVFLV